MTPTTGLAATAGGDVFISTNAGATWSQAHDGIGYPLSGAAFASERSGYVVGASGILLRTEDGGLSWSYANNGLAAYLSDIKMWDSRRGLAAVWQSNMVLRTIDGGAAG